jgi:hypothetical protein
MRYFRSNPNGVGEAFFYQSSPSDGVFAIVAFSRDDISDAVADGVTIFWTAVVTTDVPPPATCEPSSGDIAFNPSGVRNPEASTAFCGS